MLSNEQINILKKYNIPYENKSIKEILDLLDEEMLKYLNKEYNPTPKYIELEKLYDNIFDNDKESK
jgi:hypothetical protein